MDSAPQQNRSPKIFISYRRRDVPGYAGRLYDSLKRELGEDKLFRDIDSIRGGDNFREKIETAVASCELLLAVIGPGWLNSTDKNGARRLDKNDDFVRLEIEAALKRNIRVIPVLMQEATLPLPEELPPSMATLTDRQAVELDDSRWDSDVERLIELIQDVIPKTGPLTPQPEPVKRVDVVPQQQPPHSSSLGPWIAVASCILVAGLLTLLLLNPWRSGAGNTNPTNSNTGNGASAANQNAPSGAGGNIANANESKPNTNANNSPAVVANTSNSNLPPHDNTKGQKLAGTHWTYVRLGVIGGTYIIRFNDDDNGKTFNFKKPRDDEWAKRDNGETAYGYWELGENNKILLRWSPYDTRGLQNDTGEISGSAMHGSGGPPTSSPYDWQATKRD
jgi:hypothetical protein